MYMYNTAYAGGGQGTKYPNLKPSPIYLTGIHRKFSLFVLIKYQVSIAMPLSTKLIYTTEITIEEKAFHKNQHRSRNFKVQNVSYTTSEKLTI